jgi:uncharacterized protein (DUF3084 family)
MFNKRKKRIVQLEAELALKQNEITSKNNEIAELKRDKNKLGAQLIEKADLISFHNGEIRALMVKITDLQEREVVGEPAKVIASLKRELARLKAFKKRIEEAKEQGKMKTSKK